MSVVGDRAHGLVESGSKPVKIGGRAHTSPPAVVADGARVNAWFDSRGRLVVLLDAGEDAADAFVNATSGGNTQVVAASAGNKIRVFRAKVNNKDSATATVKFQSDTTDISETFMLAANGGGYVDNPAQGFIFETASGEALNVNLGGAGSIGCAVSYSLVPA